MDSEERQLIEDLIDKILEEKDERLEELEDGPAAFNPVTQPWKALHFQAPRSFGISGPTGQELRDLIWHKEK